MSARPRVAITGIGVVSPFGEGRDRFWDHLIRGVSGTRAITEFEPQGACRVAAPVPERVLQNDAADAEVTEHADPRRYSRASRIAVIAALEAFRDAGLSKEDQIGVIVGSGAGGIDVAERSYGEFFANDLHRVSPYAIPVSIVGIVASEISIALGLNGVSHVMSNGCTSSTDAIGYAAAAIRQGDADVVLTGGADACVTPGMIFGFSRMRAVSTRYNDRPEEASRPFDKGRDGFVLGEGAWILAVESEARALGRGARIYATVDGYASTCDAFHRVQMDPEGTQIVRAMNLAIERSGRTPDDIGYINYHGTSTQLNDLVEAKCVRRVFGARAESVPGSSIKSMIGHPQGASGAAGIVAAALAISRCTAPPTINLTDPDPECGLDFIANTARRLRIDAALCNCLGFGSKNSAIVLGRA
jgi:3-oxoacyl-[acyl-carrier-protein] synthase II